MAVQAVKLTRSRGLCGLILTRRLWYVAFALALSVIILTPPTQTAHGDSSTTTARARYDVAEQRVYITPLHLADGSKLTIISPTQWSDISEELLRELHNTHQEHRATLGTIPRVTTSIRLMDDESFFLYTGAPSWTNALFFRGQILIPISQTGPVDLENLRRSVKHEYTHAVIHSLSGGKAPGWIDEGLAQWAEGTENPALRAALRRYLEINDPIPLRLLQGGFTKLHEDMVPAAYAQSLMATKALLDFYGFNLVSAYLTMLRTGTDQETAFETAFRISPQTFESKLSTSLQAWAQNTRPQS